MDDSEINKNLSDADINVKAAFERFAKKIEEQESGNYKYKCRRCGLLSSTIEFQETLISEWETIAKALLAQCNEIANLTLLQIVIPTALFTAAVTFSAVWLLATW